MSPGSPPPMASFLPQGHSRRPGAAPASDAVARLARSRLALVEQIAQPTPRPEPGAPAGWRSRLRSGAGTWWRHHPAHLALELATPVVSTYAGRRPWQFLALAAASGALIAIVRPWRLLSVTGLLVAVAKSSQLSSLLLSALSAVDAPTRREPDE